MKGDLSMLGRGRRRRAWLALLLCHSSYQDVSKRGELGYVCLVSEGYVYAHDVQLNETSAKSEGGLKEMKDTLPSAANRSRERPRGIGAG
jgi:hypothetical protein